MATLAQLEIDLADAVRLYVGGVTALTLNGSGSPNFQKGSRVDELTEPDPALIVEAVAAMKKFILARKLS